MSLPGKLRFIAILSIASLCAGSALAQTGARDEAGDSRAGERLALANCSRCHAVGNTGASPLSQAPPFRLVSRKYNPRDLEEAFAEGILTGHNIMPEFVLTPDQIANLIAYLQQLRAP